MALRVISSSEQYTSTRG